MITASLFREKAANGYFAKSGTFRILLSQRRHLNMKQIDTMLQQGDISRPLSYEELLSALPDLEAVLKIIPEIMVTILDVSETKNMAIIAMGANIGWGFIKRHPVQIMKNTM